MCVPCSLHPTVLSPEPVKLYWCIKGLNGNAIWFLSELTLPADRRPGHKRGAGYAVHVTREWRRFKDKLQSNPEKYSQYRQKCRDRMRMIRMRKKLERQRSGLQWTRNEKHSQFRQKRRDRTRMICMSKELEPPVNTQLEDRITETQGMKMTRETVYDWPQQTK